MSGKSVHELIVGPITCFALDKQRQKLAFSPNDHTVHIYKLAGNKWQPDCVLTEHGQNVTGIDWAAESNRLVTCGADRNAYVWTLQEGKWKPTLVILRINRAATCVKWSPKEDKFAVGSGARLISVCYFEEENNWWVSKHIKKPLRSTVTSLDWHPSNILLAAGSTDFKARVFSGHIKEVDGKPPKETQWGEKPSFGTCLAEFSNGRGGWVHDVSFSAGGDKLAWVGHDSSISVVASSNQAQIYTIKGEFLPFISCTWITNNSVVAGGHDYVPLLFSVDDAGQLTFNQKLDVAKKKESEAMSAMAKFRTMDKEASTGDSNKAVNTTHQNSISQISIHTGDKGNTSKFASVGVDGRFVIWDVKGLEASIAGLKIA
ncbi:actin-related protein 2/3 complex subunit 1A-like [Dendronephthya gigantea]|uniref:actin-related protein 2/3 complex subunit 1A-like n=1 Tax=Dendronephthya gigantea TaxID=151771 RepID=UPI00106C0E61|nr:actin-related protein 2/3 complex subunit 1A-like [Dendronephthya gigantea]